MQTNPAEEQRYRGLNPLLVVAIVLVALTAVVLFITVRDLGDLSKRGEKRSEVVGDTNTPATGAQ